MSPVNVLNMLPSRIFSFYSEAKELLRNKMPYPRMAILHANYTCNQHCKGCDYHEYNRLLPATMTRGQACRLVQELVSMNIQAVEFAGGGEPTLDPNIHFLIDSFLKHGIAMGLLTNGTMLRGELLDKVIRSFNYVRVSLDAGTPEMYQKIRGIRDRRAFERVLSNLAHAVELRKEYRRKININTRFTVGNINHLEMEKAVAITAGIGVDSIQFSLFENVSSKLSGYPAMSVNYILECLKRKYEGKIRIIGNLVPTKMENKCWLNPIFTVIDALGDVFVCSYYRHRRNRHRLGNIFKERLRDIWFSQKHFKIIQGIRPKECNVYNCRFHKYNDVMSDLLIDRKNELDFI